MVSIDLSDQVALITGGAGAIGRNGRRGVEEWIGGAGNEEREEGADEQNGA